MLSPKLVCDAPNTEVTTQRTVRHGLSTDPIYTDDIDVGRASDMSLVLTYLRNFPIHSRPPRIAPRSRTMTSFLPDTTNLSTLLSKRYRPDQIPDLTGRTALVTGGSAGIGYWDAAALAQHNAVVHIVSANPEHGKEAEASINKLLEQSGSKGSIKWHQLDLMHLKNVDKWAKSFAQEVDRLDILIANAGIGQAPFGMTDDGLERHFEVSQN